MIFRFTLCAAFLHVISLASTGTTSAEEMENSCELVSRCEHGTACVGSHDDYYCDCPEGLEGEFCEINPSDCVGNPCQSILFSRCQDLIDGYECNCMPGFERRFNQSLYCGDIDECKNMNPCLNGTCINLPGEYRCLCRDGWTGTNCDTDKDECEANGHKCLNGAQCVDLIADFRCDCVNHYTGQYCETASPPCKLEPCQNGATCTDVDETNYRCNCPAGFEGVQCEVNIDECLSDPCVNGTCVDGIADYSCECDVAFEGKDCDVYVDLKTEAEVNGVSGQATTLTCTVSYTQSAPSQAYWKVDGTENIQSETDKYIPSLQSVGTTLTFKLKIKSVSQDGTFTCLFVYSTDGVDLEVSAVTQLKVTSCTGLSTQWTSTLETTTQFPVNPGTVVEVTCSETGAINSGSNEMTCASGTGFTYDDEIPYCVIPEEKV